MKLLIARRALRDIERCGTWWVKNRDARGLFAEELLDALERIAKMPTLGAVYRVAGGHEQRRVLMPRTGHHVYYRIEHDHVVVLTVWGARRARPPAR